MIVINIKTRLVLHFGSLFSVNLCKNIIIKFIQSYLDFMENKQTVTHKKLIGATEHLLTYI